MFAAEKALRMTEGIGTYECHSFRERIFRTHETLAIPLARYYRKEAAVHGHVVANRTLRRFQERLVLGAPFQGLHIDSPDEDVRRFAEERAKGVMRGFAGYSRRNKPSEGLRFVERELAKCGFSLPLKRTGRRPTDSELLGALARTFDSAWWRRQIQTRQDQVLEAICIELGLVHATAGLYVSDRTERRKREQWRRNTALLCALEAVNELGEVFPLIEIAKRSVSNLKNRRNELMTRIAGFEAVALERGDVALCYTLTAPSKFHCRFKNSCIPNPRYGGYTPRDTQEYLNQIWRRIRAKLKRRGIQPYGFRVAEPHHDGTPHWHILLFVASDKASELTAIIRHYGLAEEPDEPGAAKHRVDVVEIDYELGTATGYIAKYVSKNIDGDYVTDDHDGSDGIAKAYRVRVWASTWKIRQFQQIGGPSVIVWRELRRLDSEKISQTISEDRLRELIEAADRGDWAAFVRILGGPTVPRHQQLLRAWHVVKETCNKYGELIRQVAGLIYANTQQIRTREHDWTIRLAVIGQPAGDFSTGGANAPPLEFCQ